MASIVPSSQIKLLSGCKLKPDYQHSIWWVSSSNQFAYFNGLAKYTINQGQYVRVDDTHIKVPYAIENLTDCNYMIITNVGHENKHYYAFIRNLSYINNTTTMIEYEVDIIQTWYFECELLPCMVEREHSVTDKFGENLRPEPVAVGDYVIEKVTRCDETSESVVVVATTMFVSEDKKVDLCSGTMYGKVFSGLNYVPITPDEAGVDGISKLITLDGFSPLSDIVSIFMAPKFCFDVKSGVTRADKCMSPFGTYTPHNNKLFTYPFNFLRVNAGDCGSRDYRYEYWELDSQNNSGQVNFNLYGVPSCNPGILLRPIGYRNQRSDSTIPQNSVEDTLLLTGFPQCSWSSDLFVAFLAQAASAAINVTTGTLVAQGADKHIEYGPKWGAKQVRNEGGIYGSNELELEANMLWAGIQNLWNPERSVKYASNPDALFNAGHLNFEFVNMRITEETARLIDSYFDVYGYATDKVKIPNRTSRPEWNYVKTANCCISASLPTDIVTKIQNIYNKGITFWCWGDHVGDYSLDNKPK